MKKQLSQKNEDEIKWTLEQTCRPQASNFIKKETLAQVFSCEFWEISKNSDCFYIDQSFMLKAVVKQRILKQKQIM